MSSSIVPTAAYYPTGRVVQRAPVWHPSRILLMVRNSTYKGEHIFASAYGDVTRPVPALVPPALWEAAQAQIAKNRHAAKANATRAYLLKGLIVCARCGYYYVGQVLNTATTHSHIYYRCGARSAHRTGTPRRCPGKAVRADWLEPLVWQDCREIILHPGKALEDAQTQLHARTQQDTAAQEGLHATRTALGRKAIERDRIMTLYRQGQVPFDAVERQLQDIAAEEATLRQHLAAIEAAQDRVAMRQIIEMLVQRIEVETTEEDGKKHATVTITYRLGEASVAESSDAPHGDYPRQYGGSN